MKSSHFLLFLALVSGGAEAAIYKYVDAEGRVTYTNIPKKGAKRLNLDGVSTVPAGRGKASAAPAASPASFPKVDSETQKRRDDVRRKILEDELGNEKQQLAAARQAQAEGEATRMGDERNNYQKYLDRVQKLKDEVTRHEKNIAALQKELDNLK
jgi:hypothetical protein